jgi:hypothetical protein
MGDRIEIFLDNPVDPIAVVLVERRRAACCGLRRQARQFLVADQNVSATVVR